MKLNKRQQGAIVATVALVPLVFGLLLHQLNLPECTTEWGVVYGTNPPISNYMETCEDAYPYRTLGTSLVAFGFVLLLGAAIFVVMRTRGNGPSDVQPPPPPP